VGNDSLLRPDETYRFDLYYASTDVSGSVGTSVASPGIAGVSKLSKTEVGDGTVRVRAIKGSSNIQSAKIKTSGRGAAMEYYLELVTRANYGTKINDIEYTLGVLNATAAVKDTPYLFRVGFNTISDTETDVGEGGTITISNDAPVILKEQFSDIAKSANYKNVTFEAEDGNWSFTGKVAGMKDTNFTYNYDPDTDFLNRFPEHDFKFLNFPAGVNFPTTGEMRIDVSDISDNFRTLYAYLYRDGKLTEIHGTYDSGADQLVFRTNYLGRFIITDRPITDVSLLSEELEEVVPVPEVPTTPQNTNPHTGAAAPDAMVALGLLSLASAAVISRKRK
jgi:LPXTG-motif cell wall-anchored protein